MHSMCFYEWGSNGSMGHYWTTAVQYTAVIFNHSPSCHGFGLPKSTWEDRHDAISATTS